MFEDLTICPNNVDKEVMVEYNFYPAEKEVTYDSNMTGTPGSAAYVEIIAVWVWIGHGSRFDVGDYLDAKTIEDIELKILNKQD